MFSRIGKFMVILGMVAIFSVSNIIQVAAQNDSTINSGLCHPMPYNEPILLQNQEQSAIATVDKFDEIDMLCSSGQIKLLTGFQIRTTGRTAHEIKAEYGYKSRHDLYQITKTKQVVIVEQSTKMIVERTHYYITN